MIRKLQIQLGSARLSFLTQKMFDFCSCSSMAIRGGGGGMKKSNWREILQRKESYYNPCISVC